MIFNILFDQKFDVSEEEVERALLNDDPYDQLSIAYHLILDSKRRQENCK